MKLTLWRQFSSNHSAGFMLVGQFDSPTLAEGAAYQLQGILARIQVQWQQYETFEAREKVYYDYLKDMVLSPVETQIRDEYNLESFYMLLDWWLNGDNLYSISVQRTIFVLYPPETHSGPFPFAEIVEKLGGKASFWSEIHENDLFFKLTCTLPTPQDVEAMWSQIEQNRNRVQAPIFRVPNVQYTRGVVSRKGLSICFVEVELSSDNPSEPSTSIASFESQFTHFLDFIESYPCTSIEYEFYHTEPEWE